MGKNIQWGLNDPAKFDQKIQIEGDQIRLVQLCRNLNIVLVGELVTWFPLTIYLNTEGHVKLIVIILT